MKKVIIVLICLFFMTGCQFKFVDKLEKVPAENLIFNKNDNKEVDNTPKYVDDNPVKLSLYIDGIFATLDKVPSDFHETWVKKRDIAVFNVLLTELDNINGEYFQDMWKEYAESYNTKYKVAWYINFELNDGTVIDQMIYSPKDVESFYDYLEIYLYDSANVAKDVWYSHLLEKNMTDDTIMTSMKLTAGSKYEEIKTPVKVMAFTYDTEDDFDENGHYRGNSKYIVNVYNG